MKESLTIEKSGNVINLLYKSIYLGYCYREIDGFYIFMASKDVWDEYSLTLVLEKLRELNEPYNKELEEYFNTHKDEL